MQIKKEMSNDQVASRTADGAAHGLSVYLYSDHLIRRARHSCASVYIWSDGARREGRRHHQTCPLHTARSTCKCATFIVSNNELKAGNRTRRQRRSSEYLIASLRPLICCRKVMVSRYFILTFVCKKCYVLVSKNGLKALTAV